jgi:uncharacterized protein YndB with AHSA1/START domain/DNA-binding transcriptional ArsR family regulator
MVIMNDEFVFKALADQHRRTLLDALQARDGQTLGELESLLPMTRFGTMKHLQILEDAGLITTRKVGREKHHYLNTVPIQMVYERWVSKYAQPWAQSLAGLKSLLEQEHTMNETPAHVFQVFIRTTPEKLWQTLTDGAFTPQYYFGSRVESTWEVGAPYRYVAPDGTVLLDGEVTEIDPPKYMVTTFNPRYAQGADAFPPSVVRYEIIPEGTVCKLTLTHYDLPVTHPAAAGIIEGWNRILSGLKTLLETGTPLVTG